MSLYVTGFLFANKVKQSRISLKKETRLQTKRKTKRINKHLLKTLTNSLGYKLKKIRKKSRKPIFKLKKNSKAQWKNIILFGRVVKKCTLYIKNKPSLVFYYVIKKFQNLTFIEWVMLAGNARLRLATINLRPASSQRIATTIQMVGFFSGTLVDLLILAFCSQVESLRPFGAAYHAAISGEVGITPVHKNRLRQAAITSLINPDTVQEFLKGVIAPHGWSSYVETATVCATVLNQFNNSGFTPYGVTVAELTLIAFSIPTGGPEFLTSVFHPLISHPVVSPVKILNIDDLSLTSLLAQPEADANTLVLLPLIIGSLNLGPFGALGGKTIIDYISSSDSPYLSAPPILAVRSFILGYLVAWLVSP